MSRVVVHSDARVLAAATAARLLVTLVDAQAARGAASVVLTGGSILEATLRAVDAEPARDAVAWEQVDVWWGDERFLPLGHPERNDTAARAALLDALPLDPTRVHRMPASDGPDGEDAGAAAARYAGDLAAARHAGGEGGPGVPPFDVALLGMGPDGHVASLFPGRPELGSQGTVVAVRDSPKPPPTRLSLTLPALGAAAEVWVVVAGEDKAAAVAQAFAQQSTGASAGPALPAAQVRGRERTVWLLDKAAQRPTPAWG